MGGWNVPDNNTIIWDGNIKAKNFVNTTTTTTTENVVPKGAILLWSGSIASIPNGWALCNGSNGTPDLRNRFIVCAGDTYAVAATGGATTHTHTGTLDAQPVADINIAAGESGGGGNTANFTTAASSSLPPYYALAYIMKL